ncbi:MAG: protein kinase [Planctomycetes bacterium]|nr:protein kinase [Planctomycetota bacterium]
MFDRLKRMIAGSILSQYTIEGGVREYSVYTLSPARSKKTLRSVLVKKYTPEGIETEKRFDSLFRRRPLDVILPDLGCPSIVTTLETETCDIRRVEILDTAGGESFCDLARERRITPQILWKAASQIGQGLAYLHSVGLIHRGLTPEVLVAEPSGDWKILDLSFVMDEEHAKRGVTTRGITPYSAPEIIRRAPVDRRSDVFSLGAILYEVICGTPLFPNAGGFERLMRVMNSKPVEISERNAYVEHELDRVIMKAVAKTPNERYQDIAEMMNDLEKAPLPEKLGFHAPAFAA